MRAGQWRVLGQETVVVSGSILAALIPMALVAALPRMSVELGTGPADPLYAQSIMTVPAIGFALASPLTAALVFRLGLRNTLNGSLLLYVLMSAMPLVTVALWALLGSRLLLGVAGGVISTATLSVAGEFLPQDRDRLLGLTHAGGGAASLVALVLGGVLVDRYGWKAPFSMFSIALPILLIAFLTVADLPAQARRHRPDWPIIGRLWAVYVLLFLLSVGFFVPSIEGPFLLLDRRITSATQQGLILSVMPLTSVLVAIFYGRLTGWMNEKSLLIAALLSTGLGLALCGATDARLCTLLGLAITGVGAGLSVPVVASVIIVRTDVISRAAALGAYFTVMFAAQFATPLLVAMLKSVSSSAGVFLWLGTVIALSVLAAGEGLRPARWACSMAAEPE